MNILEQIAASKRREVVAMKELVGEKSLKVEAYSLLRSVLSMSRSIRSKSPGIIAEHKRRSPSKGEIKAMSDVGEIVSGYASVGAAAISVLTDTRYFGGSLADLAMARRVAPTIPLLRKEFIVDEYQLYQSRLLGADAVLLIASMLTSKELSKFSDIAHSLGMETLVEVHTEKEVEMVPEDAEMVGINNRNLSTFKTDIDHSRRLFDMLPDRCVKIAESGIRTPDDILALKEIGFDGFLIGEAFMKSPSPSEELRRFINGTR